jgi:hypothetical protein
VIEDLSVAVLTDGIGMVIQTKLAKKMKELIFGPKKDSHPGVFSSSLDSVGVFSGSVKPASSSSSLLIPKPKGWTPEDFDDMWTQSITQLIVFPVFHTPQSWGAQFYHEGSSFPAWGGDGPDDVSDWYHVPKGESAGSFALTNTTKWQNPLHNEAYRAWPKKKLIENSELAKPGPQGEFDPLPVIIGGSGTNWICSSFEGDWHDMNPDNIELVRQRLIAELDGGRRRVFALYKAMFDGAVPEPGMPSMTARWMLAKNWIGHNEVGTVEYELHNLDDFRR